MYRKTHADPNTRSRRDTNSLKVKFKQLARHFRPGHSVCQEIVEAGNILKIIEAKMTSGQCLQRRGGRARGAEGFSAADSQAILRIVRQTLPVTRADWEEVARDYCRVYAGPNERLSRDGISLKSKFRNWLRTDVMGMTRAEVGEAAVIQKEIEAKMKKMKKYLSLKSLTIVTTNKCTEIVEERCAKETEVIAGKMKDGIVDSMTSSEGGDTSSVADGRRGGRILGSEGYSLSDKKALLACVKEVLPLGPVSWEKVLQLYRINHAIPNDRAQRNIAGIKSKFKQLVHWKDGTGKVPDEVMEARAIQSDIEYHLAIGKRQHFGNESNVTIPNATGESSLESRKENSSPLARTQTEVANTVGFSVSGQVPGSEHGRQLPNESICSVDSQKVCDGDLLRSEIARRELELLRKREQREAEVAAWDKERAMREKQRMDMEAWSIVCDRLRALHRERATETNPEIVSEFDDEIAVLKSRKQRLASLI
ncbi:hypothetical protein PsorP6_002083 [Peronosclerospora sorghi]|uniref:Uncharacterized protein n=1 Tax=Peronosclerospora sorghi TaxID=230839 RepID=A0ACC0WV40_9STRA|nr:hypothetical protein PsorP6_002083 [Peronosclerospora sorghi]